MADATKEQRESDALDALKRGMGLRAAARQYGVAVQTLRNRLAGRPSRRGPNPYLTTDEENDLVCWLKDCGRKGFPRRKDDLLVSVKEYLDRVKRECPFKDNLPGDKWFSAFRKRHPDIAIRTPEGITRAAANVSEADIRKWFADIHEILEEEKAVEALNDPSRVFNCDETNFRLCPQKDKVLAEKGSNNVYEIAPGDPKYAITALFAFSASGKGTEPMLIFPYQRIPPAIVKSVPPEWGIGRSENGWMTSECFYEWIGNVFASHLYSNNIQTPVILFVDGHKTHLTRDTSVLCKDLGIILIALYPNSTHILQPCDVAAFRPIKAEWKRALLEWRRKHPTESLTKEHIGPILKIALQKDFSEALRNGFRATGLHPFNPDAVDYTKCKGSKKSATLEGEVEPQVDTALTLRDFKEIVGEPLVKSLESSLDVPPSNEEHAALLRLFKHLGGKAADPDPTEATDPVVPPIPVQLSLVRQEPPDEESVDDPGDPAPGPSGTPIRDVLLWPHSPKRKGTKRPSEKMPFVVTSKRWQQFQNEKEAKKLQAEEEKAARARAREAKKVAKEAEAQAKAAKKTNKPAPRRSGRQSAKK